MLPVFLIRIRFFFCQIYFDFQITQDEKGEIMNTNEQVMNEAMNQQVLSDMFGLEPTYTSYDCANIYGHFRRWRWYCARGGYRE